MEYIIAGIVLLVGQGIAIPKTREWLFGIAKKLLRKVRRIIVHEVEAKVHSIKEEVSTEILDEVCKIVKEELTFNGGSSIKDKVHENNIQIKEVRQEVKDLHEDVRDIKNVLMKK